MAWTAPKTFTSGAILTSADLNTFLRDNLNETAPAKATAAGQIFVATGANALAARTPATASVNATETTTATSYTDLATVGPQVTCVTGSRAIVAVSSSIANSDIGSYSNIAVAVSGATTIAPGNVWLNMRNVGASLGNQARMSAVEMIQGLTPGSNTFKMQYNVNGGTGTFLLRSITVIPL